LAIYFGEPASLCTDDWLVSCRNGDQIPYESPISLSGILTDGYQRGRIVNNQLRKVLFMLCVAAFASRYAAAQVEVYVGYAENEHLPQAFMPNPWYGSANTTFLGYPSAAPPAGALLAWDSGGILIRNIGASDVVLGPGVKVDSFADATRSYSLWDASGLLGSRGIGASGITIHSGQQVILAQTGASRLTPTDFAAIPCDRHANPSLYCYSNFDTSDTPVGATGSGATPVIHVVLNGVAQTFTDTAQVLNTAGADLGNHNPPINESAQWRLIGTTGSYLPGGSGVTPPAVTTWHNDNARTGLNSNETMLNPTSVNCLSGTPCHFGKLFTYPVTGQIYAQPLFVPNVTINGATHNAVYVATTSNNVYAFDAESAAPASGGLPLWTRSFGQMGTTGFTVYSTPVIDLSSNTLYVVTNSNGTSAVLHALDLGTGADKSPATTIGGSVPGTGDGSNPTTKTIPFTIANPSTLWQRPALLLYNGSVYTAFGSNGDAPPYHGWIFGYSASNIATATAIYNSTPNAVSVPPTAGCTGWTGPVPAGGAFWMTGAGPAADATGIYATTGNGTVDGNLDFGDSILRLTVPGLSGAGRPLPPMTAADWFTPYNQSSMNCQDKDLGSSGPLLIPNTTPPLLVQASKGGTIYLVNRNAMGKYHPTCQNQGPACDQIVQELPQALGGVGVGAGLGDGPVYSSAAYFNSTVFYKAKGDSVKGFQLGANGTFSATPLQSASSSASGATPSVSYDSTTSTSTGIVWTVESNNGNAVLHAYNAGNLQELYNSGTAAGDAAGTAVSFTPPPTVAAGKVFVGTANQLVAYGGGLAFPLQTQTLTVTLQVLPATSRDAFNISVDGTVQLPGARNNATTGPLALVPGAHAVSVTAGAGTWSRYTFSYSGACQAGGTLTLQAGVPATCTITAQAVLCPGSEIWNPATGSCQPPASCPPACKFGCFLPEITASGPVWRCKPAP
jgi:hypothetical protein